MKNNSRLFSLSSVSLLALVSALSAIGCTEETTTTEDGGPSSPDSGADAATCSAEGTGSISVVITGLPEGVAAKVKISGASAAPTDATASTTLADRPAGNYTASAERVAKSDPIVRTVYEPTISSSSFCLEGTKTQTVTVAYSEIGSSNKLWMGNANSDSGQLLAFAGADLAATGSPAAKVATKGAPGQGAHGGKSLAFDKDGNLWSIGATTGDSPLLRFAAGDLGASGEKTPDRKIDPQLSGCGPALTSIAFDPSGTLWATVLCSDQVLGIAPENLSASKSFTPAAEDFATGVKAPHQLAFDKDGNMWVSDETSLRRYPAASLAAGQAHVSDFEIKAKAENDAELPPDALAFDKDGNLWVSNFGGNVLFKLTPADLTPAGASKEVVPSVALTIGVDALIESLAFDESGGLWTTFSQGKVARIAPAQLGTSTTPGAPTEPETVVTSADIGYAVGTAFFPAPAGLPLYGRFE
ncbi:MAG: repeat containing protein [Labilithrix sp.]|nr:repeat containing protein [Labilithrix sp.]